eukprot:CAMPEP_0118828658 /NCGR_PEP_ID=MMETSP1162-20130426/19366_1 /TAXON_ID=33656 /ORGANISM="Phaeocystis Sp, Strain CCMP2710" /LENGTH=177 /DNA_ID=CAMNT_0006759693 /DNA_START=76 /DNA_END=609 /DNA_ORIENTATION=+
MSTLQAVMALTAAAAVGTAYVLIHEHRRKLKTHRKAAGQGGAHRSGQGRSDLISRELLLAILAESATAAFQLIEQTRKMVHLKHKQTGMSLEAAVDELQKDFEVAMEAVVSAIRQKHGVSEPQMTQVLMEYQADVEVQTGVQTLRDAMSGKAPPKAAEPEVAQEPVKRRNKPRQRKG